MEQLNQLKQQFQTRKDAFLQQEKALNALKAERQQAANVLSALQNELSERTSQANDLLAENGRLTVDEYVELKQGNSGLKARIEYHDALVEDFDLKIEVKKEEIYAEQQQIISLRKQLLGKMAQSLLARFASQHSEELSEAFGYLMYSDKVQESPYIEGIKGTMNYSALQYIGETITAQIKQNASLAEEFTLPHLVSQGELKSPTRKHREKFEPKTPKGFEKLVHNL